MPRAKDGRKICSKCGKEFPATAEYFYRDKTLDGLACHCKKCKEAVHKRWLETNLEKHRARLRKWYEDNREKCRARVKKYVKNNPEKRRATIRKCREKNREERNASRQKYAKRRYQTDPGFRLHKSISARVYSSLAGNKAGRSWETLVGYTVNDLKRHLESLFRPGMTWKNHGKWVMDHVRPIASFSFTSPDDAAFKECWALENLQPLWVAENLRKYDKWDGQVILPFASATTV